MNFILGKKKLLNKKNFQELNQDLLILSNEQFNLKMQLSSKKLQKTHFLKKTRQKIARIKTILNKKGKIKS